jgi:hypothetical protein
VAARDCQVRLGIVYRVGLFLQTSASGCSLLNDLGM